VAQIRATVPKPARWARRGFWRRLWARMNGRREPARLPA
jgi:hypothetical protein